MSAYPSKKQKAALLFPTQERSGAGAAVDPIAVIRDFLAAPRKLP
jgi:hypothetical protein